MIKDVIISLRLRAAGNRDGQAAVKVLSGVPALPKLGERTAPIQNQELMFIRTGLGKNGTEPAGLTKSDDGDNRVQKKSDMSHLHGWYQTEEAQESGCLRNSPATSYHHH